MSTPAMSGGFRLEARLADAAPSFRPFNPARQAARLDRDGGSVRRWVPAPERLRPTVDHAAARMRAVAALAGTRATGTMRGGKDIR